MTVGIAHVHLGPFGLLITLLIAAAKTILIVLYFMHVRYSSTLTRLFAFGGLLWFALLIGLTFWDVLTRPDDIHRFGFETRTIPKQERNVEDNSPHRE